MMLFLGLSSLLLITLPFAFGQIPNVAKGAVDKATGQIPDAARGAVDAAKGNIPDVPKGNIPDAARGKIPDPGNVGRPVNGRGHMPDHGRGHMPDHGRGHKADHAKGHKPDHDHGHKHDKGHVGDRHGHDKHHLMRTRPLRPHHDRGHVPKWHHEHVHNKEHLMRPRHHRRDHHHICDCHDHCICATDLHHRLHRIGETCFERRGLPNPYDIHYPRHQVECYKKFHPCARHCPLPGFKHPGSGHRTSGTFEYSRSGAHSYESGHTRTRSYESGDHSRRKRRRRTKRANGHVWLDAGQCMGTRVKRAGRGSMFTHCKPIVDSCNRYTEYQSCLHEKRIKYGEHNERSGFHDFDG